MPRALPALALAGLLVGCSDKKVPPAPPADPGPKPGPTLPPDPPVPDLSKVDFTVTVEDYVDGFNKDGKGSRAKYKGKVVELTGTVRTAWVSPTGIEIALAPTNWGGEYPHPECRVAVAPGERAREAEYRALAGGQPATVRGVGGDDEFLYQARLVKAGAAPKADTLAVGELAAALKDPERRKRLETAGAWVRVKVREPGPDRSGGEWFVTDPDAPDGPKALVAAAVGTDAKHELQALKVGDVVYVLGKPSAIGDTMSVVCSRVRKDPPDGVKPPTGGK